MSEQGAKPTKQITRRKTLAEVLEDNAPWKPTPYEQRHALAMKRFAAGTATGEEQKLVFEWLIRCTGVGDEPYRPGGEAGERDTLIAIGKASVGRQMLKLVKVNLSQLKGGEHGEHG